jgi:hypothetical protein
MPKTTSSDYHEALARAEAAARTRDSSQFIGALRDAYSRGYKPSHIPSSWISLMSEEGESPETLRVKVHVPGNPEIRVPPYVPMTEYKGKPLSSEIYHDYLLKQTFKPFGSNPPAGWELERRLSELHSIGVNLHDYHKSDASTLRLFWPEVVSAITNHAKTLVGETFVEKAKEKYHEDKYA